MALSGKNCHYELATIMRRHFNATAAKCGWGENAEDIITELLARVEPTIEVVTRQLPPGFPQDVAVAIFEGVRKQVKHLEGQPST
jgi:serine/threonine-protein kinase HipA